MKEVKTLYNGKEYTYKNQGGIFTWFDYRNLAVPVLIHTNLREKALAEGADISIFLSTPKPPRCEVIRTCETSSSEENLDAEKPKKKPAKTNGFNPFAKGA